MSPLLALLLATCSLVGYVIFSADIVVGICRLHVVPAAWWGAATPSSRSRARLALEVIIAFLAVAMTQLLMLSLCLDERQAVLTHFIAAAELLLASIWTAYVATSIRRRSDRRM